MKKPDTTGAHVAKLAARILGAEICGPFCIYTGKTWYVVRPRDIKAMAASLVNQAPDKPKRQRVPAKYAGTHHEAAKYLRKQNRGRK